MAAVYYYKFLFAFIVTVFGFKEDDKYEFVEGNKGNSWKASLIENYENIPKRGVKRIWGLRDFWTSEIFS